MIQKPKPWRRPVLADYFGPQGKIDTYNAMLQELGAFDAWTLEDKALYSALLVQYGWQKEEWPLYLLPDAQAADRAVIIQNAKDVLVKQFSALLDEDHIQLSYGKHLLWGATRRSGCGNPQPLLPGSALSGGAVA